MSPRPDDEVIDEALSSMHGDVWVVCRAESGLFCGPAPRGQSAASWALRKGEVLFVGTEAEAKQFATDTKTVEKVLES